MNRLTNQRLPALGFIIAGGTAIIVGGILSAFLAHRPSEFVMWVCAYLVLVAGVAQIGFGVALYNLVENAKMQWLLWAALFLYNLASLAVIIGTMHKTSSLGLLITDLGGFGLMLSLLCMIVAVRGSRRSYLLIGFYGIVVVILVSTPIGLYLARH